MNLQKLSFLAFATFLCALLSASAILLPSSSISNQSAQVSGTTGATYYVSPTGNDANAGTLAAPWKTIAKANATLQAGDTVIIRAGTYNEDILPKNSGVAGKPITYQGYAGEQVYVQGDNNTTPIVVLHTKNYITLADLNIYYTTAPTIPASGIFYVVDVWGGGHLIFKGLHIIGSNAAQDRAANRGVGGMYLGKGTADNLITAVGIRNLQAGIKFDTVFRTTVRSNTVVDNYGDAIRINSAKKQLQGLLIQGNVLGGSLTADGIQTNVDIDLTAAAQATDTSNRGIIILNNTIYGAAGESGIDLRGASDVLVQGNTIYKNPGNNVGMADSLGDRTITEGGVTHGSNGSSNNVIVRNNIIYDNSSGVMLDQDWKVYNNTIVNNNRDYTGANSVYTNAQGTSPFHGINERSSANARSAFKNNIIGDQAGSQIVLRSGSKANLDYNLYFNTTKTVAWEQQGAATGTSQVFTTLASWKNYLASQTAIAGKDTHSLSVLPGFVNVPSHPVGVPTQFDFHLATSSPAIDAGTLLTTTTSAGSGTVIPVLDSGYFFDGYGIIQGDTIQIGTQTAIITAVDYVANKLTLNKSLTWTLGQGVSLPYKGSAPDIGAYEFTPAADITPPVVALTAPKTNATVSGIVTLTASSTDNVAVTAVQFKLDNSNIGTEDTASPFTFSWNTASTTNGTHTLTAVARDAAGNKTISAGVSVTVKNSQVFPIPGGTPITAAAIQGKTLVFDDEFNGTTLDTTKWIRTFENGRREQPSNGELEWYADENVSVHDGSLDLMAMKGGVTKKTYPYSSGIVTTSSKFTMTYGYMEMRAKLPQGAGLWPAFWMMTPGKWPPELDPLEAFGADNGRKEGGSNQIHYGSVKVGDCGAWQTVNANIYTGYHTYGIDWKPTGLDYYFDGQLYKSCNGSTSDPMYMLVNLAVGGNWPGAVDESKLPAHMYVDYVRAWH
jgi:beta-glucanase (GH16 family)